MSVVRATSVQEAVAALRDLPGAMLLAGGTEVVVDLAEGAVAPEHLVTLRRVPGLRGVLADGPDEVILGALTTYTDLAGGVGNVDLLTAMAPTVGSPASRNAGTLGGALGTGSGYGDAVTSLLALDAVLYVTGLAGERLVPVAAWLDRTDREPTDVVTAVAVPRTRGSQHYLKPGERQAVSYAVVSCALVVDAGARRVRCALGSVGPLPVRTPAEQWLAGALAWDGDRPVAGADLCRDFGERVAAALPDPPPSLRASSDHRRHVAGVLASRALARAAS